MDSSKKKDADYGLITMSAKLPIPLKEEIFQICDDQGVKFPRVAEWLYRALIQYAKEHPAGEMPTPFRIVSKQEYDLMKEVLPQVEYRLRPATEETKRAG